MDLRLPVFVILPGKHSESARSVQLGWVSDFDDEARQFLILFGGTRPPAYAKPVAPEAPFNLEATDDRKATKTKTRPGQQRFRFQVLREYGCKCAVCDITHPSLMKAAHIRGKAEHGSDDWRNGLPLCSTHHDAFDAYLFAFEPETHLIRFNPKIDYRAIGIHMHRLTTERQHPHVDALMWRWDATARKWKNEELG